jgi:Mlc titration factor MtfA (ptsG expression regulator)
MAIQGKATLLDKYGASNHAEFFAVNCECFFTHPHDLKKEHPALYSVLVRLFGQDMCDWLPSDRADSGSFTAI